MDIRRITRAYLLKEAFDGFDDDDDDIMSAQDVVHINNKDMSELAEWGADINSIQQGCELNKQPDAYKEIGDIRIPVFNLKNGNQMLVISEFYDACKLLQYLLIKWSSLKSNWSKELFNDIVGGILDIDTDFLRECKSDRGVIEWVDCILSDLNPYDEQGDVWQFDDDNGIWVNQENPDYTEDDWYDDTFHYYQDNFDELISSDEYFMVVDTSKIMDYLTKEIRSKEKIAKILDIQDGLILSKISPSNRIITIISKKIINEI